MTDREKKHLDDFELLKKYKLDYLLNEELMISHEEIKNNVLVALRQAEGGN